MAEAAFDTLAAARALKDAGVEPEHAEAIADVVKTGAYSGRNELATKADLAALELRLIKWFVGGMSASVGLMIAAVKLIP